MIGTDCIGSCNSNYHTVMTTTALFAVGGLDYNEEETVIFALQRAANDLSEQSWYPLGANFLFSFSIYAVD